MSGKRTRPDADDAELAMLSAFLDGELSPAEEATLLDQLAQRPDLQDALDALASGIAARTSSLAHDDLDTVDADALAARILGEIDAAAIPSSAGAALALGQSVVDGVASAGQTQRLHELIDAGFADATAGFVATVDVTRAATASAEVAVAAALARLPDHVMAKVERQERAWALTAGAVDGQLSVAEAQELVGLAGADADHYDALVDAHAHSLHVGEALRVAAESPAFVAAAEKAGAAALQAIFAVQKNESENALKPKASTSTTTAPSLGARLRSWFTSGPVGPLVAATAAAGVFVVLSRPEPLTTASPDPGAFAALQQAFLDAAAPVVLADNRALEGGELAVIGDNSADVLAIDGTNSTVVFSTAESNITVIWVDGIDADDDDKEQGT
jgi:hypothetical protein